MERIESFRIDHNRLLAGVYVSRVDYVEGNPVTTYDLRMRRPYLDKPLEGAEAHTVEHLCATWLRNDTALKGKVVYFGPMGCLTGFYMILAGEPNVREAAAIVRDMFRFVAGYEGAVPGATREECGNFEFMDLPRARVSAKDYLETALENITDERLTYPAG